MALIFHLQTARALPTSTHWEMKDPRRLIPVQFHSQTLPTAIYGRHTASQQYGLIVWTDLHWHHAAALELCVPARTGTRGMISDLERNISSK